jgi:ADP-ribose pyrophosphatase YjhB (NUDIX family)
MAGSADKPGPPAAAERPTFPWDPPSNFRRRVPDGDNRERLMCDECGFVHYETPKIVVGSVILSGDHIMLAKRAIHPRKGYWTLPAGFMELHESTEEGARREAWEEANAEIEIECLLGLYNIPRINQVQMMYRARLVSPSFSPGSESTDVALYGWDDIPWDQLAFPSVHWALNHWQQTRHLERFAPFGTPADWIDRVRAPSP